MPSINQTSLSIYTISPFCKSVISPSIHTWYQIEKKPPNLFSCYYYSVRELLGDFFPCCCKDFFPHHQQPRLREFSGTVSPDFRPFFSNNKTLHGSLINRLKQFYNLFQFRKDICKISSSREYC